MLSIYMSEVCDRNISWWFVFGGFIILFMYIVFLLFVWGSVSKILSKLIKFLRYCYMSVYMFKCLNEICLVFKLISL